MLPVGRTCVNTIGETITTFIVAVVSFFVSAATKNGEEKKWVLMLLDCGWAVAKFHYLKLGLAAILGFVGTKMVLTDLYKIPITLSLGVITTILTIAVIASLLRARRAKTEVVPSGVE